MGTAMSKKGTVEDPTALNKMALAAIIGQKARDLAKYAQNGEFQKFRENFKQYLLLGTRDYTIFVIYVSMLVCAAITNDESEEAQRAKELAEDLLEDMHTARSFYNFGIGWGPAIYDNLKKMGNKFKEFLKIMSDGKYTNGYDSAFGKRSEHVTPWITKNSRTALQTLAVPAMRELFPQPIANNFRQGVREMGREYVSTDAATAVNNILEFYGKAELFIADPLNNLSDIRIKEDYPKLPRYSKLLMDGDKLEASYLFGTYFPLMKGSDRTFRERA